ncbi:hypothetical protein [Mucilaginibacter sp.]|jgi:hypothetical protein|uniref:hypothetical protein n=1 Tax=Mucilaginibacter sp. TaxID=1882438 RepID=UPI002C9076EC|nr:hypothetical protein [Mucilaginibacter sp.]HTI58031.1 hypothetical protein [Mucilaginibacter sp.]
MNYPFDTVGLNSETIDMFDETYKLLKSKFKIELTGNIDFRLQDFEVFRGCNNVNIRGSYVIKNSRTDCYILFVEIHKIKKGGLGTVPPTYDYYEYQTWALAYVKKDFGRVFIRPETLADKIVELVHPVELDFADDKAFSDIFYVLVNDRWKAESAMDRNFRNAVMDVRHEDILIEIIDHTLIIGHRHQVSPESSQQLADFVARICSTC